MAKQAQVASWGEVAGARAMGSGTNLKSLQIVLQRALELYPAEAKVDLACTSISASEFCAQQG